MPINLAAEMVLEGYRPKNDQIAIKDAEMVDGWACWRCGDGKLVYSGWQKGRSYRAFAVCLKCGQRDEF